MTVDLDKRIYTERIEEEWDIDHHINQIEHHHWFISLAVKSISQGVKQMAAKPDSVVGHKSKHKGLSWLEEIPSENEETEQEFVSRVKSQNPDARYLMVDLKEREVLDKAEFSSDLSRNINLQDYNEDDLLIVRNYDGSNYDKTGRTKESL